MKIFSKEDTGIIERIMPGAGIPFHLISRRERKYFTASAPKVSILNHKCLEDFIRAHDFIF
ncbi:MAG: hypothetical protein KJ955_06540 [Nanoarchaeota archaeon]|nr:hypothetical protein [Nanoarchaeota archaeon]